MVEKDDVAKTIKEIKITNETVYKTIIALSYYVALRFLNYHFNTYKNHRKYANTFNEVESFYKDNISEHIGNLETYLSYFIGQEQKETKGEAKEETGKEKNTPASTETHSKLFTQRTKSLESWDAGDVWIQIARQLSRLDGLEEKWEMERDEYEKKVDGYIDDVNRNYQERQEKLVKETLYVYLTKTIDKLENQCFDVRHKKISLSETLGKLISTDEKDRLRSYLLQKGYEKFIKYIENGGEDE